MNPLIPQHTTKPEVKGPIAPVRDDSVTRVIPGANTSLYLSFDRKKLSIGQKVFQIGQSPDNLPILKTYIITSLEQNDFVSVQLLEQQNLPSVKVKSNNLHTSAQELLQYWLLMAKFRMEVELPKQISSLVDELKKIDPNFTIDNLVVGQDLKEDMEI